MAKKTATNIVEVWSWLVNIMEDGTLNATEQAVLFHVIAKLNRNMWEPAKLNTKLIAAAIDKDPRTVKSALNKIVNLKILKFEEGEHYLGEQFKHNPIQPRADRNFKFKREQDTDTHTARDTGTNIGSGNARSRSVTESVKPSGNRRQLFNEVPATQLKDRT